MAVKEGRRTKAPELLAELGDHATSILSEQAGIPIEDARKLAKRLVDMMRQNWGGQLIYFPKGRSIDSLERARQILEEFDGSNHLELSKRHGLTIQTIYEILRAYHPGKSTDTPPE